MVYLSPCNLVLDGQTGRRNFCHRLELFWHLQVTEHTERRIVAFG
jgi:hypothetical protein